MKYIRLSNRLKALADLIDHGASVADVGTDHGYLPVYLAQTGLAVKIIASDVSAASLVAARRSAAQYNVADAITFIVIPGLEGLNRADICTVVIAGMGGETIRNILKDAPWTKHHSIKLILQPQSKIETLCRFLYDNEYEIKETKTVNDKSKSYTIIVAGGRV